MRSQEAHGCAEVFDRHWQRSLARPTRDQIFTRGRPRNVIQMYHRLYVEDLWAVMGQRAAAGRYLELGSGRGTTSMYLASRGCDVTLVDLSPTALELARINFAAEGLPEPALIEVDAERTGLPAESFDCVYNIGLLEHFEDPTGVLGESLRLLRPGGLLFSVIVPTIPPANRLLAQTFFAPWRIPRTLRSQQLYRREVTALGRPGSAVVRTVYSRQQYADWARQAGGDEATCIAYNAYHGLFRGRWPDVWLQRPVYQLHAALRGALGRRPRMATWPCVAQCDLLTCRKPLGAGR